MDLEFFLSPIFFLALVVFLLSGTSTRAISRVTRIASFMRTLHLLDRPSVKAFFHWKHSNWVIALLWGSGLAMLGLVFAAESVHVTTTPFIWLSYALFGAALLWSLASWLTSETLVKKNPVFWTKKKRKKEPGNPIVKYRFLKYGVSGLVVMLFAGALWAVHMTDYTLELHRPGGKLIPDNDPRPDHPCNAYIPENALVVYAGGTAFWFEGNESSFFFSPDALPVISTPGEVLLGIIKEKDGKISITAHIRDKDRKVIALIDDNKFKVNEQNRLSMDRDDLSTLVIVDQYGDTALNIRYLNPRSVRITGKLYYGQDSYVEIGEKELFLYVNGRKMHFQNCIAGRGLMLN